MNKSNASKWMELGSAMLQGKTIQRLDKREWVDVETINTISYNPESFRIKPEQKKGYYRIFMKKDGRIELLSSINRDGLKNMEAECESSYIPFFRWITDRMDYEIPE